MHSKTELDVNLLILTTVTRIVRTKLVLYILLVRDSTGLKYLLSLNSVSAHNVVVISG